MKVPFNDLSRIHKPLKAKILKNLDKTIDENQFILGEAVKSFEHKFSEYTNSKYTISCSSGTDAIELIIRALGIGFGDEVILPTNTFIATALAVTRTGAKPVLVDNNDLYLIDYLLIEKKITKKTKAIIGVHLYGQQANNLEIAKICKKYNLFYIEDAAQAHGSLYKRKPPGTYGIAAAYSFYPGKNLGAWGDGGAITTNNKGLAKKLSYLRNWGSDQKYIHKETGFNSRLNTLQALVLSEKLNHINEWNQLRNEIALMYLDKLSEVGKIILPEVTNFNEHVWHLFVIRTPNRKKFFQKLNSQGIELGIHYPLPIHKQQAYKKLNYNSKEFPKANDYTKRIVSLPIFPRMKKNEVNYVIDKILNVYS